MEAIVAGAGGIVGMDSSALAGRATAVVARVPAGTENSLSTRHAAAAAMQPAERDDHDDSSGGKHTLNATYSCPKAGRFLYPREQRYAAKV